MKNLLLVLIGVLIFVGCRKSFKEVKPMEGGEEEAENIMSYFDISPSDTAGLRIFGVAAINTAHGVSILGNKNGYLWVQILEPQENNTLKKITNFTTTAKFNDRIEIDLGYGEKTVIETNYINWDMETKWGQGMPEIDIYTILFHDKTHFLLNKGTFSWIICKDAIFERQIYYYKTIANGYIGSGYVCDEKGEPRYEYKNKFDNYTFVNLYEYIDYSTISIFKKNAETDKLVWHSEFGEMGQVIDGHEPKIEHTMQITDNTASCTFNITNYDGSKETKNFKVNIDTGEIAEL